MPDNRAGLAVLDTQARNRIADKYRTSMKLPDKINCGNAFETYREGRLAASSGFGEIKLPDGKTLESKLNAQNAPAEAITSFKQEIADSLKLDNQLIDYQKNYEADIAAITRVISKKDANYSIESLAGYIKNTHNASAKALDAQHKQEISQFEAMIKKPDFINNLKAITGATDDQVAKITKDMQEQLKKAHADQKAQLDKTFNDEVIKLHNEAMKQRDRVSLLGTWYEHAKTTDLKDEIDQKAQAKNGPAAQNVTVQLNVNPDGSKAIFKNLDIKDLDYIQSITGNKIEKQPDGSYHMALPSWGLYYHGSDDKAAYDFSTMATAIKASGFTEITMQVDYPQDPEYATTLAKKAAEACVFAGFSMEEPPEAKDKNDQKKAEITIVVNGQPKKISELFANDPQGLQRLRAEADRIQQERRAAVSKPATAQEMKKLKDEVAANRAAHEAAQAADNTQQNTVRPGAP